MNKIKIVEKKNALAVHGLFDTVARAENHLKNNIPEYVRRGYYMDKNLTADDFAIVLPDEKPRLMTEKQFRDHRNKTVQSVQETDFVVRGNVV